MGRRNRKGRPVTGILLFDKSPGHSSNKALQQVKRLFDAQKAGHTGSLDPLASGLLPICFGEATKISGFLLDADKRYQVTAKLGVKTSTGDAEGEAVETVDVPEDIADRIARIAPDFQGDIQQIPPMYSALKHQGRRLYELAREGVEVERPPRNISIHELTIQAVNTNEFSIDVRCSKGTYVRTLIEDMAEAAGTVAHVTALRRLSVGGLPDVPLVSLDNLQELIEKAQASVGSTGDEDANIERVRKQAEYALLDALLLAPNAAFTGWPKVKLDGSSSWYIQRGQAVQVPKAPTRGQVLIHSADDSFLGIGEIDADGRVAPKRLFVTQKSNAA